mgnify:CR=1 FL=1
MSDLIKRCVVSASSLLVLTAVADIQIPTIAWEAPKKTNNFTKPHRHKGAHKANARKARKSRK